MAGRRCSARIWLLTMVIALPLLVGCFAQPAPPGATTPPASPPTTSRPESPQPERSDTEPTEQSSDGAEVTVRESAVTATKDSTGPMASYAVEVENPSADIAYITGLQITLLDADGNRVTDRVADGKVVEFPVYLVMPGERQTITNLTYVGRKVADIEVAVLRTLWFAGDNERMQPVEATEVAAHTDDADPHLSFQVDWPYDHDLGVTRTYAAFRNSDGDLIGGTAYNDAEPLRYEPGVNEGEIDLPAGTPTEWDSVEVFVQPFVQEAHE